MTELLTDEKQKTSIGKYIAFEYVLDSYLREVTDQMVICQCGHRLASFKAKDVIMKEFKLSEKQFEIVKKLYDAPLWLHDLIREEKIDFDIAVNLIYTFQSLKVDLNHLVKGFKLLPKVKD